MTLNYYLITPPLQVPLKLPLKFSWRRGPDMPFGMHDYVQSVVVEGIVYVGGGYAGTGSNSNCIVTYDISTGKWATLPPYRVRAFAMTAINNQLVLVGGAEQDNNRIKVLGVWDADNQQWTHPYPEMHTARSSCSAVVYKEWLVVAGGWSSARLSSVEVMNTNSKQWYAGHPTPTPWSYMRTAVVGDTCFFMGGSISLYSTDKVYTVSLSALTSGLTSKEPRKKYSPMWSEISGLQLTDSTPLELTISGSLLAVFGGKGNYISTTAIHLYQPDIGKWVKVGDLPRRRQNCICAMISEKEILVAGGYDEGNILKSMDIALLK